MVRPLRIVYPGAVYHVTARGNERKKIFLSQADYRKFLSYLTDAVHKYGVILYAFALMGNHYHLLVEETHRGRWCKSNLLLTPHDHLIYSTVCHVTRDLMLRVRFTM